MQQLCVSLWDAVLCQLFGFSLVSEVDGARSATQANWNAHPSACDGYQRSCWCRLSYRGKQKRSKGGGDLSNPLALAVSSLLPIELRCVWSVLADDQSQYYGVPLERSEHRRWRPMHL